MIINYMTKQEASSAMEDWRNSGKKKPSVNADYEEIRERIEEWYKLNEGTRISLYQKDFFMGLCLYEYFRNLEGFSLRVAANDGFWRYLSVKVVPHIVADRWGDSNDEHFWKRNTRIWLRSVWWFVHLSWRGSIENTRGILESPNFNTDTIMNLVERSGREGTFVDVYRWIMLFYSQISQEKLEKFNNSLPKADETLFRVVMKLNTAKTIVMDPALYSGGIQEYVKSLFAEAGCSV